MALVRLLMVGDVMTCKISVFAMMQVFNSNNSVWILCHNTE